MSKILALSKEALSVILTKVESDLIMVPRPTKRLVVSTMAFNGLCSKLSGTSFNTLLAAAAAHSLTLPSHLSKLAGSTTEVPAPAVRPSRERALELPKRLLSPKGVSVITVASSGRAKAHFLDGEVASIGTADVRALSSNLTLIEFGVSS